MRILSLCAALCAAVVVVGGSGAGTAKVRGAAKIDVSTRAAVVHYLRSIHVNPRGVVIQRGARNYAGARCPGKGWNCASTKRPVVQVAAVSGKNMFSCSTSSCAVVQIAAAPTATNTAKCIKTTGLSGTCTINQSSTSANNVAIVLQLAAKGSGLTQTATYSAQITQRTTGAGAFNRACVLQQVSIDGSTVAKGGTPVNVNLAAHQTVNVKQDSATGDNVVQRATTSTAGVCDGPNTPLTQAQTLTSTAQGSGPITQNQNSVDTGPNIALDIAQNQSAGFFGTATGANTANFVQTNTLTAIANTPAGPVNQTQSSANGGILAGVNQDSRGLSTASATQMETQCEDAHTTPTSTCHTATPDPPGYSLTQTQFGPMRKGGGDSVQTGNENCVPSCNTFTVTQNSKQDNDTQDPAKQTNLIQGDCTTTGNCTVTQTTNVDGTSQTNTQSGQNVDTQTTCSGSTCTSTGPTTTGDLTLLPNGLSVSATDVAEFGDGGMRGSGTGSITVTGVSAPVFHAFLYWNGPTNSADPAANADVTFDGSPITGTNIGISGDNNWGFQNSQSYRADVTSLVTGNGTYSLANFVKVDADINGVALIVFYDNGNSGDDRNVVLWNGNDSNCLAGGVPENWDETINGVPYQGGSASLDFVVADGQSFTDGAVLVNGSTLVAGGQVFDGDTGPNYGGNPSGVTGSLWDVESFDLTSFLTTGSNNLHITSSAAGDCLSLVVAAANVPASAPVILSPAAPAHAAPAQRRESAPLPAASGRGGGVAVR
jgi:hypothetical protein